MAEVETTREGAVLTITLNRPDVLNAFNAAMHKGLAAALKEARGPDVRAVVITGAGRGFCVGQDLTEFKEAAGDIGSRLRDTYHPNVTRDPRAREAGDRGGERSRCRRRDVPRVCVRSAYRRRLGELRARLHQHRARPRFGRLLLRHADPRAGAGVRVARVGPQADGRGSTRVGPRLRGRGTGRAGRACGGGRSSVRRAADARRRDDETPDRPGSQRDPRAAARARGRAADSRDPDAKTSRKALPRSSRSGPPDSAGTNPCYRRTCRAGSPARCSSSCDRSPWGRRPARPPCRPPSPCRESPAGRS